MASRTTTDLAAPFLDPRQVGFVEITKALEDLSGDPVIPDDPSDLDGAVFVLQTTGGQPVTLWPDPPLNDPATCTISGGAGSCVIGPVPIGDYQVVETVAPPGTILNPTPVPVTIIEGTVQTAVDITVTNALNPIAIHLEKTGPDVADVGDTFTYTFQVTNTGDLPLTDVTLEELNPERCNASPLSGPVKSPGDADEFLEINEIWTWTCQHLVTPADGTSLPNTAETTGTDQFGRTVSDIDDHVVTIRYPDLNVAKTPDGGTVQSGGTATFTIVVTNQGAGKALNATLSDTLPPGTWTLGGADAASCSIAAGTLTCNFGTIAAGGTRTITLSRAVTIADCGTITNNVTVSTTFNGINIDTDGSDNADQGTITVQCPNVSVTKVAEADPINAGDTARFTITVSNTGPGSATGVTLLDTLPLPGGLVWSIDSQTIGGCSIASGTLTCPAFDLAAGQSRNVVISALTDEADCGTLTNTAVIAVGNGDTTPSDNSATDTIEVRCPNLEIVKTADDGVISAGDTAGFTITVTNVAGAAVGTAYGVTLEDTLPSGLTWVLDAANSAPHCSLVGVALECGPVDLAPGQSFSVHVTAATSFQACATYENTAFVDATNTPEESNFASINCLRPDLDVTKVADEPSTVNAGDDIGFTISVANGDAVGTGTAYDVTLTDPLPGSGLVWTIDSVTGDVEPDCEIVGALLTCEPVDLEPGESYSVHITATTSADECSLYSNTATANGSNTGDPVQATDEARCLLPGLNIAKTADDDVVEAGDLIGFTIEVLNNLEPGGTATGVVLSDNLPAGVDWSIAGIVSDPAGLVTIADCAITGTVGSETLTCDPVDLEPGESFEVHITAPTAARACAVYDNTAVATPTNAPAVDDDAIIGCLDIEIVKGGPTLAHVGDTVTYTFDVTNTGGVDLVTVALTDPNCDQAPRLVDDGDGDTVLSVGETWRYDCTRLIEASDPDPVPNTGTVVGTDVGGNQASDDDDHLVDVIHPAIQIVKTVNNPGPAVGETVTYTYVVTNTGDTTLFNVVVTDDKLGAIGTIPQLAPGQSVTVTKTAVASNTGVVNVGTATGADVLGKTVSDTDDAEINPVAGVVVVAPAPAPLPRTGSEIRLLVLVAGLLLVIGGALVAGVPRRRVDDRRW